MAFIKAAMPTWQRTAQENMQLYLQMQQQLAMSSRSASVAHERSPPACLPWETKITPPHVVLAEERARRAAAAKAKEALLSPDEKLRLEQAAAAKAEAAAAQAAAQAEKLAVARAQKEAEAKRRALAEAKEQEISEAGEAAAAAAAEAPTKTAKELIQMRDELGDAAKELEATRADLAAHRSYDRREDVLKRKLGDAILARGAPLETVLKEWDPRDTDAIGRADFKQHLRMSLSTLRSAPNDVLEELFVMLDVLGTGLIFGVQTELLGEVRRIVAFCEAEHLRERDLLRQKELAMQQVELLAESIQASEKWEETEAQLHRLQSEPPTLETKLGHLIQAKLREVMLFKDVADDMGADANGLLGKDSFVKYVMGQRGNGQLRIDGGDRTAVETLGNLFEKLANGPARRQ